MVSVGCTVLYCTVVFIACRLVIYVIIIHRIHVPGVSIHYGWCFCHREGGDTAVDKAVPPC